MVKNMLALVLAALLVLSAAAPLTLVVEHRFGTAENWKKRGTVSLALNPENMKYKVEHIEDEVEHSLAQDKKKLEVACMIEDVYSLRLLQGPKVVVSTSIPAVFSQFDVAR